jgi:2-polyprenyl-3-methyl-5-hydroxy-6-metoxy-1,4-benzoquinol methylase
MKNYMPYQEKVNTYFQSLSSDWNEVYIRRSVFAETIQARHNAVLDWIESLALAPNSHVLEIGCGAGLMAITLAQQGLRVQAIDSSMAMVQQARQNAQARGAADLLKVDIGDIYALAFEDNSFDLVLAVGVLPWLHKVELAIQEMARVTKPKGHIILTTANWIGLPGLLDPQLNPALTPLRQRLRTVLKRVGLQVGLPEQLPKMVYHRRHFIEESLKDAGLLKIRDRTLGFGPFSLFCHSVLPDPLGLVLHHRLQRLADQHVPVVRSLGKTYLVLASKVGSR